MHTVKMNILTAFNTSFDINIQGTAADPLFQADQIGHVIGMTIDKQMIDVDESDLMGQSFTTSSGEEQLLLTRDGVNRVLIISGKPVAWEFYKWITKTMEELKIDRKSQMHNQLQDIDKASVSARKDLSVS